MPYNRDMEIIETKPFARRRDDLFDEEQFREFGQYLTSNPMAGDVIPGGSGLRKIRWSGSGRGKRGGVRVIYYFRSKTNRLFLIVGYHKNECEDLTKAETKSLAGIIELLVRNQITISGRRVVIVGRGALVGKPLVNLLLLRGARADATVTVCHTRTRDLAASCLSADILVAAAGRPRLITGDMVGDGVVVVDAGTNSIDGKLVGDVDFDTVAPKASAITPVPGGVGPMTVAMLLANVVLAAEQEAGSATRIQ